MDLIREFERAGLGLELTREPIVAANADIFQMDIRRGRGREWFRLWRGHESNEARVADADRGRRQLVLLVREKNRAFLERIPKWRLTPRSLQSLRAGDSARVVREEGSDWIIERRTSGSLRRFLCGSDEAHLFVAQFEGGTTVRDAHRRLKPKEVLEAERSHSGRTLRQGEWFFAPLSAVEGRVLAAALAATPYVLRRDESLGGNGRAHVAEAVVLLEGRVFARGAVRHPDHKTLVLDGWRRVYRNAEVRQETFGSNGVYWID